MGYFYGPVPSRRLGISLGVDLIPLKTCSFDCLYCQLGRGAGKTAKRRTYIDLRSFQKELKVILKKSKKIDYITISGSGEPTLHKGLDKIIKAIKKISKNKYPVCVITNSSLLYRKKVRQELKEVDLIVPSLDAATPSVFQKINRPCKGITFEKIVKGLITLRKEYKGRIWLEIMLIGGINDTLSQAEKFKKIIGKIKPDKIQLNTPVRPAGVKISLPGPKRLKKIQNILSAGTEVITSFSSKKKLPKDLKGLEKKILRYLEVRPATVRDFSGSLGLNSNVIIKSLNSLLDRKRIKKRFHKGKMYFVRYD